MTLSRLELGFESPWGRHYIKPPSAAFCCLPPPSLVFTGFPLIASLRMIVQNSELFGIVGYTFAREVGDKVGDAPDPPL